MWVDCGLWCCWFCLCLRIPFCLRGYGCLLLVVGLFDVYGLLCLLVNLCCLGLLLAVDCVLPFYGLRTDCWCF